MSGVSGTCRSDLRESKSSAIASGSLGSRDVPLEYSLTAGNAEFQAKLLAAALPDQQTGMSDAVTPIPEDDAEDVTQTPIASKAKLSTDAANIKIVNQAEQDSHTNSRHLIDQDTALQTQISQSNQKPSNNQ